MIRALTGASIALALAACASAPRKSASEPVALPDGRTVSQNQLPSAHRKRSPYAPAQEDTSKRGHYTRGGLYAPHIQDSAPDDPLHDVDRIPEPEVVSEPRSRYGNRSPYQVLGKSYSVRDTADGYVETGLASYYGNKFHGRRTSNLEVYDMYAFTAAHKTLPLPSFARVTNLDNGQSVVVRVNDRGPFHDGRVIDLSYAAAVKLGYRNQGTARVEVRGLSAGENAREPYDAVATNAPAAMPAANRPLLPPGVRIATGKPQPATAMDRLVGALPIASANAGERPPQTAMSNATPPKAAVAATTAAAPSSRPATASASPPKPGTEWRFDMLQDGKAMTADEFDAWMKSRRARVATGKPVLSNVEGAGKPDKTGSAAPGAGRAPAASGPVAPPPPTPQAAAAAVAAATPAGGQVTLQVASFANQTNAGHALAMLRGADIAGARLQDASVNGRQVWRLRVGPVEAARAPELAARVVGLGFDQPQRVRE